MAAHPPLSEGVQTAVDSLTNSFNALLAFLLYDLAATVAFANSAAFFLS